MPDPGQVKGASFVRVRELVRSLIERGVLSLEALEVRLSSDALSIIDQKLEPSLWYPIAAVDELSQLLVEFEGNGRPEYMREVGRQALDPLLERDTFRSFIDGAMRQRENQGQTLVLLAGLVYDFGDWSFEGENLSDFTVTIEAASALPELAAQSISGFMQVLVERYTGIRIEVGISRPDPERVVFRASSH